MSESTQEPTQEAKPLPSNAEVKARWAIDPQQDPYSIELGKLNPGHGDYFEANTIMGLFERLHAEAPVHRTEESQYGAYWNITRFEDCKAVDTQPDLFSSDAKNGGIRLGGQRTDEVDDTMTLPMFIMQDRPVHDEQRAVVAPMFTPRTLASFESLIRSRASDILDELPRGEDFDWVQNVSVELTSRMLATLFDVPQEDRHKLIHWSDTVERLADPEYFETVEQGMMEIWGCFEYFQSTWTERSNQSEPGLDLISFLANGCPKSFAGIHPSPICAVQPWPTQKLAARKSASGIGFACGIWQAITMPVRSKTRAGS